MNLIVKNENSQNFIRLFLHKKTHSFIAQSNKTIYFFIVASQQFLLKEEPLEEVLRERFQYCQREKKQMNFWLIESPKFLEIPNMDKLRKKIPKESVAIVSTNESFVRWLKLRYHHVGIGSFIAPSNSLSTPLRSSK